MKELSIEEKANAYDNVRNKIAARFGTNVAQEIFSEYEESENEKIRKWLINEIKIKHHNLDEDNVDFVDKAIAWLEKQQGGKDKFTQQHSLKEDSNVNDETNAPTEYGKYVDECLNEASKHFFSEGEDKYSVADLFYAGVRCGKSWLEKQGQKSAWSKEDEDYYDAIIAKLEVTQDDAALTDNQMEFLKSLKQRHTWKPSNEQMEVLLSEVNGWKKGCPKQIVLESLYNDLKKLK